MFTYKHTEISSFSAVNAKPGNKTKKVKLIKNNELGFVPFCDISATDMMKFMTVKGSEYFSKETVNRSMDQ